MNWERTDNFEEILLKDAILLFNYFKRSGAVHKFPVPRNCLENYFSEQLLRTLPLGYEKCSRCFSEKPV